MEESKLRKLIVDMINEYDDQGYILSRELIEKYEKRIIKLTKSTLKWKY